MPAAATQLVRCRCDGCPFVGDVALSTARPARVVVGSTPCPRCRARRLRLAPRPLPRPDRLRVGMYDEPADELGDEELHDHRRRMRST